MAGRDLGGVFKDVQTLFSVGTVAALSDDYLLDSFLSRHEGAAEVAFEALVRRHGPMVLRICREELRDVHAAEDAFQGTFLVLARKAGAIRNRGSVASWLFGVARRVSKRAKVERVRREVYERRSLLVADQPNAHGDEHQAVLDSEIHEEIDKLPEKYRSLIVLCYLSGLTHEEAASQLCLPVGTVKVRLSRARERLRGRLVRRGLAPIVLAATIGGQTSGAVASPLLNQTVKAALQFAAGRAVGLSTSTVALVNGVLKGMYLSKLKTVAALLVTSLTAIFTSLLAVAYWPLPARSDQPAPVVKAPVQRPAVKAVGTKDEDSIIEVAVETLKKSDFRREAKFVGSVNAVESAVVRPRVSGILKNVLVDIGDSVKQGQILAEILEPELDVAVQKAQAQIVQAQARVNKGRSIVKVVEVHWKLEQAKVAEAEAALRQSEAAVRYRQKESERIEALAKSNSVEHRILNEALLQLESAKSGLELKKARVNVAKAGPEEAQAKLDGAMADLVDFEADVRIAQAELDAARIRQAYTEIRAPFDGMVTRRGPNHAGEFVRSATEAGSAPLLTVVGLGKMKVAVDVPDSLAQFLDRGDPVTLDLQSGTGRNYSGEIARTSYATDPNNGTLSAEIDFDNRDGILRPGKSILVTIVLDHRRNVLSVPEAARIVMNGESSCYRIVGGRAVRTPVQVGAQSDNRVEVLSGLQEGDTVVVEGIKGARVSDGQPFKVKPSPPGKASSGQPER
jgi:HlyD family secretion protein